MPNISVIVPVYKVEPYIHRCVDSILNQTFTDFELILVDDGSPDNCGRICDEYSKKDSRIVVIHKDNGGLSDARNAGIDWAFKNSNSEWITFIDSDDWVHKKYLELLYDAAIKTGSDVCSCGHLKTSGYIEDLAVKNPDVCCGTCEQLLLNGNNYWFFDLNPAWGRLYKRKCFNTARFPFGRLHEDAFICYKILFLCEKNSIVKEILYYYFQNENSITNSNLSVKRLTDLLDAFEERIDFFYNNNSISLFQKSFMRLCNMTEAYYEKYKHNTEYLKELTTRKRNLKTFTKKYHTFLPEPVKKYGYKKNTKTYQVKKQNFRNDFNLIEREKGIVYSILWAIKTTLTTTIVDNYYIVLGNLILLWQKIFNKVQ